MLPVMVWNIQALHVYLHAWIEDRRGQIAVAP